MTLAAQAAAYLKALDAERRAEESEGAAFSRWFSDRTDSRAGTARKAKSRADAAHMRRIGAETTALWNALDAQPWDDSPAGIAARSGNLEAFARAITEVQP